MRLAGKSAVITGASTGIGRACALKFAGEGARLVLADLQDAEGEALSREIERAGGTSTFLHTDVASRADSERAVDHCVERYGGIDILFCNAGITLPKVLHESSDAEIDRLLGVNLLAVLYAARHAIPRMLAQPRGGTMLFTASKTGLVAQYDSPARVAVHLELVHPHEPAHELEPDEVDQRVPVRALQPAHPAAQSAVVGHA